MKNKNLLIYGSLAVLGVLAYNYYNKKQNKQEVSNLEATAKSEANLTQNSIPEKILIK